MCSLKASDGNRTHILLCLSRCTILITAAGSRRHIYLKAGDRNRTDIYSLEGYYSTIELHPRICSTFTPGTFARCFACRKTALALVPPVFSLSEKTGGQERIRTSEAQVQQISRALKLPRGLDYLITLTFRFRW